jgi:hypothetical protein
MPEDDPFPSYRDVDLALVLDVDKKGLNQELPYKGLILECASASINGYRSPQVVLADPGLAPNLLTDSILSDPAGMLGELHRAVKKDYARRKWVLARCDHEKTRVLGHLEALGKARSPGVFSMHLGQLVNFLSGLIAVAYLQMPTHRRCLILSRALLARAGRPQLHETVLDVFGCVHMDRSQVEAVHRSAITAFDRAVEVYRTPCPYGFKLQSHVRPYFVAATQAMIDEGYHREAMGWIWFVHWVANTALQNDAPAAEKSRFQAGFDDLLRELGLLAPEDWPSRLREARALVDTVFGIADMVVEGHPDIVDG